MDDLIMTLCSILFMVLFFYLLFIFIIFIFSLFVRQKKYRFRPKVSIIIPVYNEEKNIKDCVDSILNSDYPKPNIDMIIIDDGSTDATLDLLKQYKDITILKQNHKGKTEALNYGIKKAKNEYILTIDADTVIDKKAIREIVAPFADQRVGSAMGTTKVRNTNNLLGIFQNIEYHYNNLIRNSFSKVFNNSIWFFGTFTCYRKSGLEKAGLFRKDTLSEDVDMALSLFEKGYTNLHVRNAYHFTTAPSTLSDLYEQRYRWWMGVIQSLRKHMPLFNLKTSPSILFLFINHYWWSVFAFISLPAIIYEILYWLPSNSQSLFSISSYLFRWFSLFGPFYVIYKIPEWGLNFYNFFGVFSGIISAFLIIAAIVLFKDKFNLKNLLGILFYFPYTIVLNIIILLTFATYSFNKKRFFIR